MTTIGHRVLLASFPQLLVPRDDEITVDVDAPAWKLKVQIAFDESTREQSIAISPIDEGVRLVFQNWSNSIGVALKAPAHLARLVDGSALEFMAANYRIGDINVFTIQFLHNKATT